MYQIVKFMPMNKQIILLVLSLLLINIASASLGTFKQDSCINLKTILNTSSVNISSISYPNSTVAISNQAMTKIAYTFNYTFCDTNELGTYVYDYFDVEGNVYVNDFKITPTGNELTTQNSMIIGIILVILIVITILFFIFGVGSGNPLFKIGFLSGTILMIVFIIGYLLKIIQSTIGEFTDLVSGFTPLYVIGIGFLGAWGIGIVLYLVVFSLKLFYKSRGYTD